MSDENTDSGRDDRALGDESDAPGGGEAAGISDPKVEPDSDPGLTGQLRALRMEELDEHAADEPLWGFERVERQAPVEPDVELETQAARGEEPPLTPEPGPTVDEPPAEQPGPVAGDEPVAEATAIAAAAAHEAESAADEAAPLEPDDQTEPVALEEALDDLEGAVAAEAATADEAGDVWDSVPAEPQAEWADECEADSLSWEEVLSDCEIAAATAAATVPAATALEGVSAPREMDLGPERRGRGWIWIVAMAGVLIVAGVIAYAWWWTTMRPITVPDVTGKRPAEATQALNDAGLRLGTQSEKETSAAPPGTIVIQAPKAGAQLNPGDSVALTVATSPDTATVPDVSGTTRDEAEKTLARVKLRPYIVRSYSATAAADSVTAQVPLGGEELPAGSTVAVVVSSGTPPSSVAVPRVTGLTEDEAVRLVEAIDLRAEVYRSADPSVAVGVVFDQTPAARATVAPQATVQILVSEGKRTTPLTVPTVVGLTRDAAIKAIKKAKLKSTVLTVPSKSVVKGRVISQMPTGGKKSATAAVVGLLVSAGDSRTVVVPSLIGTDTAGAEAAITAAALTPVVIEVDSVGRPPGVVFAQFPSPRVDYQRYFPMIALVAKQPAP